MAVENLVDNTSPIREELQIPYPLLYRVLLHNDDYTPMDFVVQVLEVFFHQEHGQATETMMQVHRSGVGVCGVYPREIAETRVVMVNEYSRKNEHPLRCTMVEEDDRS